MSPSSHPQYFQIENLGDRRFPSPLASLADFQHRQDNDLLIFQPEVKQGEGPAGDVMQTGFELAGPRDKLFFEPATVKAAIVTCGGLCPGLNAVIRGLVMQLWHVYGCENVLGIRYGYHGLGRQGQEPMRLTPALVSKIKGEGGTILGSSRGTPPTAELVDTLEEWGVNMLFVIGGDGSMRGGLALWQEIKKRGVPIAVVGVPKTIDNDIPYVQRTFGFDTAVAEAVSALNAAELEAKGMPNGIGLVKLMGRHAGFIAAAATVASGNPNFCLIPEVPFSLNGQNGLLNLLKKRLVQRHHAVIVIAEGAGQNLVPTEGEDASGNPKLGDIGRFLKQQITADLTASGIDHGIKYIEPSYLIRSAPPTASDQLYCDQLARAAVDAAMAGKGGLLIGDWNGRFTHLPMQALAGQQKRVNPAGELWFSVLENTGQPRCIA